MEMAGLSVSSDVGEGTITLISYDDNQFEWAKEELNKGSITPAMENTDRVLVTYDKKNAFDIERFLSARLKLRPDEQFAAYSIDLSGDEAAGETGG